MWGLREVRREGVNPEDGNYADGQKTAKMAALTSGRSLCVPVMETDIGFLDCVSSICTPRFVSRGDFWRKSP